MPVVKLLTSASEVCLCAWVGRGGVGEETDTVHISNSTYFFHMARSASAAIEAGGVSGLNPDGSH